MGDSPDSSDARQQLKKADQQIKRMLAEGPEEQGRHPFQIQQHFVAQDQIAEQIEARKWGYAGWLVTNPGFRKKCAAFRKRWEHPIRAIGGFPV